METMKVSVTTWPVVQSAEEADVHDHNQPALVAVPGHLVRPISVMIEKLFSLDTAGTLARGIEMQLVGLAEPDSSCVACGLKDANAAARNFAQHQDQFLDRAEDVDMMAGDTQEKPKAVALRLIDGGAGAQTSDEPIPAREDDEDDSPTSDGDEQ